MVKVKICGVKNLEVALNAAKLGADALGFVFTESKRRISPEQARSIIEKLPPFVTPIGVFVDEEIEKVDQIASFCKLQAVQLHGSESPEYCSKMNLPVIKAFKISTRNDIENLDKYCVKGYLLDAFVPGQTGGTGNKFPWELVKYVPQNIQVILAGGLNGSNVEQAIKQTQVYGVDVSSGVETNGIKDINKIEEFIKKAKYVS